MDRSTTRRIFGRAIVRDALLILSSGQISSHASSIVELAFAGAGAGQPVDAATSRQWFDWLTVNGFAVDRCGFNPLESTFVLEVPDDESLKRLTDAGFSLMRTLRGGAMELSVQTDSQYFDPDEIETMLKQVAADHPTITRLFSVGKTFEGRNIFALEISDQPGVEEDEPAILFNAEHHAREVATSHVLMDVVNTLTDGFGGDATITEWVNDFKTVCVPTVNPDGVQFVFDGSVFWRKNRQVYAGGCTGVDLNRNYPYRWGSDRCGSTTSCSGVTYKGPSAASELETQAMMGLADSFKFVMATSYHSFGRFIDYPYACSTGSPNGFMPEHGVIDDMMNGVADAIDAVDAVPRYRVFSPTSAGALSGDDTSWYYAHMGVYSFIIEVGTAFEPAFSRVGGIVNRNRAGWQYMYDRLGQARIDVHVTDACTEEPIEAEVTLTDFVFDTGELPRRTFLPFGRWTFVVEANQSYNVSVSEPGYTTQDVNVNVGNAPAFVDIVLVPTSTCEPPVLDIKPESCPNSLNPNPKGKGVVPMTLVGSESFDVTNVNLDTLALFRPDGVGESVFPLPRSRGQTGTFEDVAGPAGDDPCACSEAGGDGFDDLVLKFSTREIVRAFQLDSLGRSVSLTIALRGELLDGTEFAALDCVRIVGSPINRVPELDRAVPANP